MTGPAQTGDEVYLGSMLANLYFWGVVGDGQTPPMIGGSFELINSDGSVVLDALVGPQGPAGENAAIVDMQYDSVITDPSDLPSNLGDNDIDIGKAYWIGNYVYVWSGSNWFQRQMGTQGPPGPTPNITFSTQLVPSGTPTSLTQPIEVTPSGTALNPSILIQFDQNSITGPAGPSGPIRDAADYDNSVAPTDGQVITWNASEQKFFPSSADLLAVSAYSIPESNFTNYSGLNTTQQIGAIAIPPQPFAWKPIVFGHIMASGLDASENPLTIGSEVLIGDPSTGQRIGRGFGNFTDYSIIVPHFSTPASTNTAVSPANSTAMVPAYHTGNQGTIYVRLYNDGALGLMNFNSANAQLTVLVVPVSNFVTQPGS